MRSLFTLIFLVTISFANSENDDTIEALPNVIFSYDKLRKENNSTALQVDFNKGVSFLEKGEYKKAIELFEKSSKLLKIPSFLNIGIAYYKLNDEKKAKIYFEKIYNMKELMFSNTYSYMASSYYLYKISDDEAYLDGMIEAARTKKNLTDNEKRMLADTYVILKNYKQALKILDAIPSGVDLKKAIIYFKLKDYLKAETFLERARKNYINEDELDTIYWLMTYRDLKVNDLSKIQNRLDTLSQREDDFNSNQILPLKIVFNKYKYTPAQYLESVRKYPINRQIDMLFYFAPFIFSDNQEVIYDSAKGFIFDSNSSVEKLDEMIQYNENFIKIIKKDPIIRVQELRNLLSDDEDSKSYVYYNYGLALAQIQDFYNAHKNFLKAYKLNPGNKLYGVMSLISAKRVNIVSPNEKYIEKNIDTNFGLYNYFAQMLYGIFINERKSYDKDINNEYKGTILYSAIEIFNKLKNNQSLNGYEELFTKYHKDPLVYLMKLTIKEANESQYIYVSRLQDNIPLSFNSNFIDGSVVVTEFYIDTLKGLGLLDRAIFDIPNDYSPSYLRSYATKQIYDNNPRASISILEYLQEEYELQDRYTLFLIVAAFLAEKEYNQALLQISLIKAMINDSDANFLSGVELIQEMKINSAKQYFKYPYNNRFIDFDLIGIDEYLESL